MVLFRIFINVVFSLVTAKQESPDFVRKTLCILLSSSVFNDCPAFTTKQSASPLWTAFSTSADESYSFIFQKG